jgi:hypothetical protein
MNKRSADLLSEYSMRFQIDGCGLLDDEEGLDLVHEFTGEILHESADKAVGMVKGLRVALGDLRERPVSTYEVFDEHSGELLEVFEKFFDIKTGDLREDLELESLGDLLLVNEVQIDHEHRGRNLGLLAMRRVFKEFGSGCSLAIIKPFPLQYSSNVTDANKKAFLDGQKKLRDYWGRLGFRRFGNTHYSYLDLALRIPGQRKLLSCKESESKWLLA